MGATNLTPTFAGVTVRPLAIVAHTHTEYQHIEIK